MDTKKTVQQLAIASIKREVRVPKEVLAMLQMMGCPIPENMKEIETDVVHSDEVRQIVIPKSMTKLEASKELEAQHKNEEQLIDTVVQFEGWNWKDVLVAIRRVTEHTFGWIKGREVHTFFGIIKPTEIDIVVDIVGGKPVTERAFYNNFDITAWEAAKAEVSIGRGQAMITINAKRKYAGEITQYFNLIREQLETGSIYRGRNIVVSKDADENIDFEIIENKGSDMIVLNSGTQLVIDNFVTGSLEDGGKRTFLFTGSYGNGKTEIAMKVGRIAVAEHGMSFFYVKDANLFEDLLVQSKKYQPCIIFLEDLDEISSGEERDNRMNSILNTLDGVQTKGNNLTTIFTTNHPERINSALRRPGRIDLIIPFTNPDEEARGKIMIAYFGELRGFDSLDIKGLAEFLPDAQGAVIAEICKRAVKLASKAGMITSDHVIASTESMAFQLQMMQDTSNVSNEYEQFFRMFGKFISPEFLEKLQTTQISKNVRKIKETLGA